MTVLHPVRVGTSLPATRGMIGRESLAGVKRGMILVNLSRGDLVDPDALVAALEAAAVPHVSRLEVAGPGFVNFHLAPTWLHAVLADGSTLSH